MDNGVYRIIDANLNRVMEGIRVCEDIVRFASDDAEALTRDLKTLRHDIFGSIRDIRKEHLKQLIAARDTAEDIGVKTIESEKKRDSLVDLFLANAQRGKESLRVLEEVLKLFDGGLSQSFKDFRYRLYEIEKTAVRDLENIRG